MKDIIQDKQYTEPLYFLSMIIFHFLIWAPFRMSNLFLSSPYFHEPW